MPCSSLQRLLIVARKQLNIPEASVHSLRHSFSSLLANAGIAEETRMALTGHTTRAVHQHYTHHDLERLRDAVAVLPRI
jgi:integrase